MINTSRYDLGDSHLISSCRRHMKEDGVCVLADFLTAHAVHELRRECDDLAPLAYWSASEASPYLAPVDETFPQHHPNRTKSSSSVGVVAYDQFPMHSALRALYEWDSLKDFVRSCLGLEKIFRYADPFGALNLAIMRDGDKLGWHFDMTDFVVSLALQSSRVGGDFENAKHIRSASNDNYEEISRVLHDPSSSRVRTEPMTPGTLMLFNGRWSMHRVTKVVGEIPRYVALLAYDAKEGTDSSSTLKISRYGRLPKDAI